MRKSILFFMLTIAVSLYGYAQQTNAGGTTPLLAGQWSVEKANEWYAKAVYGTFSCRKIAESILWGKKQV